MRYICQIIGVLLLLFAVNAFSEQHEIKSVQRLSEWLLKHSKSPRVYLSNLSWYRDAEKPAQRKLKYDIVLGLSELNQLAKSAGSKVYINQKIIDWFQSLPVTGRITIPNVDPRWLEVNPEKNPVLLPGDKILLPTDDSRVTVVLSSGEFCDLVHVPNFYAGDYIRVCHDEFAKKVDVAWIAQPDGQTHVANIQKWNLNKQDRVGVGAWIWAPQRGSLIPSDLSNKIVAFLATQILRQKTEQLDQRDVKKTEKSSSPTDQTTSKYSGLKSLKYSASNWGVTGLMQVPSARFQPEGSFVFQSNKTTPYHRYNLIFTPFDWLEGGFRYVDVKNRLYGPISFSGYQTYKDKSFEFKVRLLRETHIRPQLSFGMRDFAGTGIFAGEYLIGSKRLGSYDFSLGLGWGNIGARGQFSNPIGKLVSEFENRPSTSFGEGGDLNYDNYFRGKASLLMGLEFHPQRLPLTFKIEVEGNDYKKERIPLDHDSLVNVGLNYRFSELFHVDLGWERGNTGMIGFTLKPRINKSIPRILDPKPFPVATADNLRPEIKEANYEVIKKYLEEQTGWSVIGFDKDKYTLFVYYSGGEKRKKASDISKAVGVLNYLVPDHVKRFVFRKESLGIKFAEYQVFRDEWVKSKTQLVTPGEYKETVRKIAQRDWESPSIFLTEENPLQLSVTPNYRQTLGTPNSFLMYQLSLELRAKLEITKNTNILGKTRVGLYGTYDKFTHRGESRLPRVRTYLREYVTQTKPTIPRLVITNFNRLTQSMYASFYGGYLEEMFAGYGAEWLYVPHEDAFLALGINLNRARQRSFEQDFGLRDYEVTTGHLTTYINPGYKGLRVEISAGKYLAGDLGGSLTILREFENGASMGGWVTRTNVSAADFGEGSFDKGVFFTVPFDAFLLKSSSGNASFSWRPLTRDGGAFLARPSLYGLVK